MSPFSLVTACMNRESHLRQTLPRWLELPGLAEVVIVDWSTRASLDDLLALDERVRLVRVDDEPGWALAYAYNLGIRETTSEVILKCDADCMPVPAIAELVPAHGHFYAGDWRDGKPAGKECVNGQCLFTRDQWTQVNGYSEIFRRYGRDDVDFYERLAAAGHTRRLIPQALLGFVAHTHDERVANHAPGAGSDNVLARLQRQPAYHEAYNSVLPAFLPWGPWFPRATFLPTGQHGRRSTFRRDRSREIPISPTLHQIAHAQALRHLTGQLCQLTPPQLARLDEAACHALLTRHFSRSAA